MYSIRRFDRIEAWLEANASNEFGCKAMAIWVKAVVTGPKQLANGILERHGRGHRLYYATVPGTGAMVVYIVLDAPARIITIVDVVPAVEQD